ncbi:MAG: hypothetical protein JNM84_13255 [Planctomycetes bacterium]|nr:hypothetical protein [Planctomycetota bacterium]
MSSSRDRRPPAFASVQQALTQMRFLTVALALGVLLFAAVATFVGRLAKIAEDPARADMETMLLAVAGALSVVGLASSFTIPALVRRPREGAREGVRARLGKELSALVVGAALLEAPGLFWCVLALMFQSPLYAVGGAVAGALILLRFPTGGGLEERLGSSLAELERRLAAEDREAP